MRVAIEARGLSKEGGGVKRYINSLLSGLRSSQEGMELSVIIDRQQMLEGGDRIEEIVVKRYGEIGLHWWLQRQVPAAVKRGGFEVVHYTKADVPVKKSGPTVVTIYDVIPLLFPQSQRWLSGWYWPGALRRAAKYSDHIITISQASKADIIRQLGVDENKISVITLAVDGSKFQPRRVEVGRPYILYVGTIEPRKNVVGLVRAYNKIASRINWDLRIVGRNYKGEKEVSEEIRRCPVEGRIKRHRNVTDERLLGLYQGAGLFVWPSIYEGWGWPPQEAMACGVPVIVSDGGALPEVVGEAGRVVKFSEPDIKARLDDGEFINELAENMLRVLADKNEREVMVMRGLARVQGGSNDSMARKTRQVYEDTRR